MDADADADTDVDADSDSDSNTGVQFDCGLLAGALTGALPRCCGRTGEDAAEIGAFLGAICEALRANDRYIVDPIRERACYEAAVGAWGECAPAESCEFKSGAGGPGAPCRIDSQCYEGHLCENSDALTRRDGNCEPVPEVGEDCLRSARCVGGTFCHELFSDWTCHERVEAGGDCSAFDPSSSPCVEGAFCDGEVCEPSAPRDGDLCAEGQCAAGHYCDLGVCRLLRANGESCESFDECESSECVEATCVPFDLCRYADNLQQGRPIFEWIYGM